MLFLYSREFNSYRMSSAQNFYKYNNSCEDLYFSCEDLFLIKLVLEITLTTKIRITGNVYYDLLNDLATCQWMHV